MKWTDSVAPLRERNFRWFFGSRFVNMLGSTMASVALAFAVLDIADDSATALGQVLAARMIPTVIFLLGGGVIADRFPRRVVLQFSNVGAGLIQGAIALLVITRAADLWMLIVLSAFQGVVSAVAFPAMSSIMPQLVPRDQLQQANALQSLIRGGLNVIGPTVAALLVVTVGPGWALMADALTWLAAAALLLGVRIPPRPERRADAPSAVTELREGWTYFWQTTWLWVVVVGFGFLNAIQAGALFTLGPAVAKDTFGEQGWGLALSAESAGLLLMTVVMLRVPLQRPLLFGMLGIATLGLPIFMLGAHPVLPFMIVAMFVAGVGTEVFSIGWNLAMQENIEEDMLSRAYSYDALGSFVAIPLGQLAFGPLGAAFGYRDVLMISGVAYVIACAADPVVALGADPAAAGPRGRRGLAGGLVEQLQQVVGRELDVLVPPLAGPVDAGDQAGAVHAAQVAVHERVARLGLVVGTLGEPEVPGGVLVPGVLVEVGVLRVRTGLRVAPVAVEDVLLLLDQLAAVGDGGLVHRVRGHVLILPQRSRVAEDPPRSRRHEAVLGGPQHRLGAALDADLAVGRPDVGLDRVDAEEGAVGDLLVGESLGDEGEHLGLARAERRARGRASRPG